MENQTKTTVSLSAEFPYDLSNFQPDHPEVETFDRGAENSAHRFSIKSKDEKYCLVSDDEKFAFDLMDGKRTIDEIAALFMEARGRIALTMIRNLTIRLWKEGLLLDSGNETTIAPPVEEKKSRLMLCPLPGQPLSKILYPTLGIALLNPLAIIILLILGLYGCYILSDIYSKTQAPSLFTFQGNPLYGMLVMMATFSIASIIRFKTQLAAHAKYKVNILKSGLMMGQVIPGLFIESPGLNTLKSKSRLFVRISGMITVFGIAGILLILFKHLDASLFKENQDLFVLLFQVPFYLLLYLMYHCCPILDNDLYLASSDYIDEPYLRKSSFAFVSRHIKKFFAPSDQEQGDNVIYIMFSCSVILWLACTAQLLLSAISHNAQILSGLFSAKSSASSWAILVAVLLPVLCGFFVATILIYKFLVKAISSQEIFKNTRNLIVFCSIFILGFLLMMRLAGPSTKGTILAITGILASGIAFWHSTKAAQKLRGSQYRLQYFLISALMAIMVLDFTIFLFDESGYTAKFIILISFTVILSAYSSFNIKNDWGQFINRRKCSITISGLMILATVATVLISGALQEENRNFDFNASLSQELLQLRTAGLFCLILCGISFILNIPGMVYRRGTQSFAPNFVIIFATHLALYFYIISGFNQEQMPIYESLTACALLLAIGIGAFKIALTSKHNIAAYPMKAGESEKATLITAFKYIVRNTQSSIQEDFGDSRCETIMSRFDRHARKMGWEWTLEEPMTEEPVNVLGNVYDQAFAVFKQLSIQSCGADYVTSLMNDIDDHFHSSAKEIVSSRISSFSRNRPQTSHIILTSEAKADIIKDIILFQDIEEKDMPQLLECLHSATYDTGDLIIKQYDEGDRLFILVEGKAQVEIEDLAGNSRIVSYMIGNEFFGEIALLTSSERTASIRAVEQCTALYIKRKDFDSFLGLNPEKKEQIMATMDYLRLLKTIPLFRGIDSSTINLFASTMTKEKFSKGDDIIKQGDEGDKFYAILSGSVIVHVIKEDGKRHDVATLTRGEYFGEIALFKNIPRTATITASTDETLVISLQKDHFLNAIDNQQALELNLENVTHRRIVQIMN